MPNKRGVNLPLVTEPLEKSWISAMAASYDDPNIFKYSTLEKRYRSRQVSRRGYLLLSREAFKDENLPSGKELMEEPVVFDALNKYFDEVIENKYIYELTQNTLMMRCCHYILHESSWADKISYNLAEKVMDANFPPEWKESTGPLKDEKESKWFSEYWNGFTPETVQALGDYHYGDAWYRQKCVERAVRKGRILLLQRAFSEMKLPSNPEVLDQRPMFHDPFGDALNNYFDHVAEEKKIDVSENVDAGELIRLAYLSLGNDSSEDDCQTTEIDVSFDVGSKRHHPDPC